MKYTITERDPLDADTRVFSVQVAGEPDYQRHDVWFTVLHGKPRAWCSSCSSILSAMSGSCAHASAVKRHHKRNRNGT